jgi:hypothetical protein
MTDVDLYLTQEIAVIPWLKRDEGIATVVLRVAQALGTSVPLERQAFSVGVGEDKPQGPTVALPGKIYLNAPGSENGLTRALIETLQRGMAWISGDTIAIGCCWRWSTKQGAPSVGYGQI